MSKTRSKTTTIIKQVRTVGSDDGEDDSDFDEDSPLSGLVGEAEGDASEEDGSEDDDSEEDEEEEKKGTKKKQSSKKDMEGSIPLSKLADIMNQKRRQNSSSSPSPDTPPTFSIELLSQWQNLTYRVCSQKLYLHQLAEVGALIHWGPQKKIFTSKNALTAAAWRAVAQDLTQDRKA
ncbi:MAG: hypothetical protein P4L61_01415 [Candidatus Pacebacteria bacterium]|nr:hypothetical protein [Candidatus Paceibacterota bacterium]